MRRKTWDWLLMALFVGAMLWLATHRYGPTRPFFVKKDARNQAEERGGRAGAK